MKVKLIQMTENPIDVMWVAARTCYSAKSPIEMWNTCEEVSVDKKWKLVKQVLSSGHQSIAENVSFTFAIEGVSRSLLAQITRHRAGVVFAVQSQRYVEIKEDISLFEGKCFNPDTYLQEEEVIEVLDKYFVWDHSNYSQFYTLGQCLYCYLYQVREGVKPEDARYVLPNATKTNITMTINLRELMHVCALRLCSRASLEIRSLFKEIKKCVSEEEPELAKLLYPSCVSNGFCSEAKSCGAKPKLKDIVEGYNRYKSLCDEDNMYITRVPSEEFEKVLQESSEATSKLKELFTEGSIFKT